MQINLMLSSLWLRVVCRTRRSGQAAPTAEHPTRKMDDTKTSVYHHWGGLPATLAALDGFQTVRADDPNVAAMFSKLDRLDAAVGSAAGLVAAMTACQFTALEMSRINSPLLDGLWKAVTGRDPDGVTPFEQSPTTELPMLLVRLVFPRLYEDTLRWIVSTMNCADGASQILAVESRSESKSAPGDRALSDAFQRALVYAFAIGQRGALEILQPRVAHNNEHVAAKRMAFDRAVRCGHFDLLSSAAYAQSWMSSLTPFGNENSVSDTATTHDPPLRASVYFGHVDIFKWLLQQLECSPGFESLDAYNVSSWLLIASYGGHAEMVEYLLQRFKPMIEGKYLHNAWCFSLVTSYPRVNQALRDAAVAAGVQRSHTERLKPLVRAVSFQQIPASTLAAFIADMPADQRTPLRSLLPSQSFAAMAVLRDAGLLDALSYSRSELSDAVRTGDVDLVRLALDVSAPMLRMTDLESMLISAAIINHAAMIELVLDAITRADDLSAVELRAQWSTGGALGLLHHLKRFWTLSANRVADAARHGHLALFAQQSWWSRGWSVSSPNHR